MFRHVVLFRWRPGCSPEQVEAVTAALQALVAELPGVRSYHCGPDLGLADANHDFGIVAEFEDRSAWDAYMAHPEHDRIRAELISPIVADRAVVQLAG